MSFLFDTFGCSTSRIRQLMTHLESWRNFGLETCALYAKILIWTFDIILTHLEPTFIKSQGGWRDSVKAISLSISMCKMTQKTYFTWHDCDLPFSDLLWPESFQSDLSTYAVLLFDIYWQFGWFRALCGPSNQPENPKCERATFDLWPDLTRDLNHKCSAWINFWTLPRNIATTPDFRDDLGDNLADVTYHKYCPPQVKPETTAAGIGRASQQLLRQQFGNGLAPYTTEPFLFVCFLTGSSSSS